MTERTINQGLRSSLLANDPFQIYHLVKFEKPKPSLFDGATARVATDYAYITDAPYNVEWDDSSQDSSGTDNGIQTYVANKLISVGATQETTEARATTMSLRLSSNALGASISLVPTITATYIDCGIDLAEAGFSEGDKLSLELGAPNAGKYVIIDSFTTGTSGELNSRIYVTPVDTTLTADAANTYTISVVSEELSALILDKTGTLYSNYINREVFVYRVHADPVTGEMIGDDTEETRPFLIFRGIISSGSMQEAPDKAATITWGLTSHWGDFVRVQGRLTSDAHHRALGISGRSDPNALIRSEYANDYGFAHAEESVNVLATYQTQELRYKTKKSGGLFGKILGKKKLVEEYIDVDREVDLRFNLSAKYLPVVYGVQKVSGIPIFADTEVADPSQVYAAYAICEGEIGGIYDIYLEGESSVCTDNRDFDARARDNVMEPYPSTELLEGVSVKVVCYGRADEGYVLGGSTSVTATPADITYLDYATWPGYRLDKVDGYVAEYRPFVIQKGPDLNAPTLRGLIHEEQFTFEIPINATFIIHTGKPDQRSDDMLTAIALNNGFKVQQDYFEGDPADYWGPSFRLLDTAYASVNYTLSEGETSIPEAEFVVKGKYIECYNYDATYKGVAGNPSADGFNIGDTVTVSGSGFSHPGSQIIDKWTLYDRDGNPDVRFRWRTNYPNSGDTLVNIGSNTTLSMTGPGGTWNMVTYDHVDASGPVGSASTGTLVSVSYTDNAGLGSLTVELSGGITTLLAGAGDGTAFIASQDAPNSSFKVESISGTTATLSPLSSSAALLANLTGSTVYVSNIVAGATGGAAGDTIRVSRVVDNATTYKDKRVLAIAGGDTYTESPFYSDFVPQSGDGYALGPQNDERVSINPAMQLLDYITNKRYGKGLDINGDLNLDTWLESGRLCDDQSKITIVSSGTATVGDTYEYRRADNSLLFQGTVSNVNTRTYNGTKYEIEFDLCIGKLGYKWNTWRTFTAGDLVWGNNKVAVAPDGKLTEAAFNALPSATVTLDKVGGGGTISVLTDSDLGGLLGTNNLVRSWNEVDQSFSAPGYSLHDSDDVKYWKYIGWEEPEQRWVTRHQFNQVVNTDVALFDNINSMLAQFNGIMSYVNGKYELDVKTKAPSSFTEGINSISEADIIGDIKIDDKGQRSSYNSLSANIVDPATGFAARSISFFDSSYLKEDKGVPKQGNFTMPSITNYYAARTNVVQNLKESRYGLTLSFKLDPKAYLLKAGKILALNYSRFNWVDKLIRITTIGLQPDGTVAIVADEHNDEAYLLDYMDRDKSYNPGASSSQRYVDPPTNLVASTDLRGEVELTWTNSANYNPTYYHVEIWGCEAEKDGDVYTYVGYPGEPVLDNGNVQYNGNDFTRASLIDTSVGTNYVHDGLGEADLHVWFYWIRYSVPELAFRDFPAISTYEPVKSGEGVEGRAFTDANLDAITIIMTNEAHTFPGNYTGYVDPSTGYVGSGTDITVYEGATPILYDVNFATNQTDGTWHFETIDDTNITVSASITPDIDDIVVTVGDHTNITEDNATINYVIQGKRHGGETLDNVAKQQSFTVSSTGADGDQGADGVDAKAAKLTAATYVVVYDEGEANPVPSGTITLTATSQNVTTPWYRFEGDGFTDQTVFSAADTLAWPIPATYFNIPQTIQVFVSNGDQVPLAFDSISITGVHPGSDGAAGADGKTVVIAADTQAVTYDVLGANPQPTTVTLTATAYNNTGTPYYKFIIDDVDDPAGFTTNNQYVYTLPASIANLPTKIEVEFRDGSAGGVTESRDQIEIYGLQYGADAITIVMPNNNHSVYTDNQGVDDMTGSGTSITVYEGATKLYYDADGTTDPRTWGFSNINDINVTVGSITPQDETGPSTGQFNYVDIGDHSNFDPLPVVLAAITYEFQGLRVDGSAWTSEAQQSLVKSVGGEDGESARSVRLESEDYAFTYDENGSDPTSPNMTNPPNGYVTVTAVPYNSTSADRWYEFFRNGVLIPGTNQTANVNTIQYTPDPQFSDMPEIISVKMREDGPTASVMAEDSITMIGLQDAVNGVDAISTHGDNLSHTVPALADGTVTSGDLAGSGITLRVWEGATELDYDGTGTAAGKWTVSANRTDITGGTITDVGLTAVMSDYTGMTQGADIGTVEFTITGTREDGTTAIGPIVLLQTLTKSKEGVAGAEGSEGSAGDDARGVVLTAPTFAFTYDPAGTPTPANAVVTATPFNTTGVPYYRFLVNDVEQQASSTTATYTYTPQASLVNMPDKIEVELKEDGTGNVLARDQIAMQGLGTAESAITIVLTNEAHTVPTDSDGNNADFTNSGTDIRVWGGSVPFTYDDTNPYANQTFRVSVTASPNVTEDSTPTTTTKTVANDTRSYGEITAFTADTGSIEFTITAKDVNGVETTYTKEQTFSKSKGGTPGIDGSGVDGITIIMSNSAHTVSANETGVPYTMVGSGTDIFLYEGNTALKYTTGTPIRGYWTVDSVSYNGLAFVGVESDEGDFVRYGDHGNMDTVAETATVSYNISGRREDDTIFPTSGTILMQQTFSKSKKGDFGEDAPLVRLTADSYVAKYDPDTENLIDPPSITLTATPENISPTAYYRWTGSGIPSTGFWDTDPVRTLTNISTYFTNPKQFSVEVSDSSSGPALASDSLTISALKDGSDAIEATLASSASISTDENDVAKYYDGAGIIEDSSGNVLELNVKVMQGDTDVTSSASLALTGSSSSGTYYRRVLRGDFACFLQPNSSGAFSKGSVFFAVSLPAATWSTDQETFEITATYGSATFSLPVTVSKAKDGDTGPAGTGTGATIVGGWVYDGVKAGWTLGSDGVEYAVKDTATTSRNTWLRSGAAGDYEVQCTVIEGALTQGSTDIWQNLGSARNWATTNDACTISLSVRETNGGPGQSSAIVRLETV